MVIGDFDVVGIAILPAEADAPLLIDSDTKLSTSITFEGFETVCGWNLQILQIDRPADHGKLIQGPLLDVDRQAFRVLEIPDFSVSLSAKLFSTAQVYAISVLRQ